jgi:hypothetical protein|tara:strand:+ start:434 stop:613 length:180 start_codon:yes stop_codon:yes gene_type:complete
MNTELNTELNTEAITQYVYTNYKNLKDKVLMITEHDTYYSILSHKDGGPLILSKNILNK